MINLKWQRKKAREEYKETGKDERKRSEENKEE
jgi:hypothetical protein